MKVYISSTLRNYFGKNSEIETTGKTIQDIIDFLTDEYPESKKILFDDNGALRRFIKIYAGDEDHTGKDKWNTQIEGDEILFLPSIAGGSPRESIISDERRKEVALDDQEIERFGKHLMLRETSVKGQKRIKASKVVVFGAGALGSAVIQYLSAAGVGTIKVVDTETVTLENLQSQVIHSTRDLKRPKVASARDFVRNMNRSIVFEDENTKPEADNIASMIEDYDVVVDCSDNYKTRYLINDACALLGIPEVYGAIYQYEGRVGIFNLDNGPCLRCLYPAPPEKGLVPTCAEGGSISPLPGIIGSIQANETLKLIMGIGEILNGRILSIDSLNLRSVILKVTKDDKCTLCGSNPEITAIEDFDYEEFCGLKEDENEIPVEGFTPEELAEKIEKNEPLTIIDVREPHERAILRFPEAIVIPIGQLERRMKELDPDTDTVFICKEGKRSILAINTLREAGYKGPMYNLKGGIDAMKDIIFSHEGAWL